jgi:predicted DNA repair protein MutK
MSLGLVALLDDIAGLARVAAASLDDVAAQAMKAGVKSAGLVIDDAAVTPTYVVGLSPARELPMIWKITRGSLRNKLLLLLPIALALSYFAPWMISPLLMLGGLYLCYEGAEKVFEAFFPHAAHHHEEKIGIAPVDPKVLEAQKVSGAIRTDFILSAEIMAIALSTIPDSSFVAQAVILAIVGVGITILVYGGVALIVKADDVGLALVQRPSDRWLQGIAGPVGWALVKGMPYFLKALSVVGTAAMIWVGGGILVHGVAGFGWHMPEHLIHDLVLMVEHLGGVAAFLATAVGAGIVGLAIGLLLIPLVEHVVAPLAKIVVGIFRKEAV